MKKGDKKFKNPKFFSQRKKKPKLLRKERMSAKEKN